MTSDVRSDPADFDGPWMTAGLESAGVAKGATVLDVALDGWIGTGQTGSNARLRLTWDQPDGRPATVVAKLPSRDEHARTQAFSNGTYRKEWTFYDRVARTVRTRTPHCWFGGYDAERPGFVLIMEDLAQSRQGDQLEGLTLDQVHLAVEQAVALHAPRWGDPTVLGLFADPNDVVTPEEGAARLQMVYGFTLAGFLDRLGSRLDADVVELAQRFASKVGRWTAGTGTPPTVVHHDFRADNLLFGQSPSAPPLVVVDWQTVGAGLGGSDLAYLVSGSFPDPSRRAAVEGELVEEYRRRLSAAGVDISADDCWRDYRFGSLWGMVITVIATVLAAKTERGDEMFVAMAQRHGRQAIDLDALALLD